MNAQNKRQLGTLQLQALSFIREHPGCPTSDLALHMGLLPKYALPVLLGLVERKLIGRQQSLIFGNPESTWQPELVDD
jgi:DNA-binding MarR family transcriptional regulator